MIVAVHRANHPKKTEEIINSGISSLEVDVFMGLNGNIPELFIGHEKHSATGQTLEDYVGSLIIKLPQLDLLWLDCKDLNVGISEQVHFDTLNKMDVKFSIKQRILIESRSIESLLRFRKDGWRVAYYADWEILTDGGLKQQELVMNAWYRLMANCGINGISYPLFMDEYIAEYFKEKYIGDSKMNLYAWAPGVSFNNDNLIASIKHLLNHLSVLLVNFESKHYI